MYSRKIKLIGGKKKSKSPAPVGSSWGPRIALIEKQKALTQTDPSYVKSSAINQLPVRKQNSYCTNTGQPLALHIPSNDDKLLGSKYTHKKVSVSSLQSSSIIDDGSSVSNNYIYNYTRKTSTSNNETNKKSFFLSPVPSSSTSSSSSQGQYQRCVSISNKHSYGGSTYILGSNSGSHVTLSGSTVGGDTVSQPLTLVIPPCDPVLSRLEDEFEENRYNVLVERRSQDSFPSTRTYRSTDEEEENQEYPEAKNISHSTKDRKKSDIVVAKTNNNNIKLLKNSKSSKNKEIFFSNPLGILKVSTTKPIVHHATNSSATESNKANITNGKRTVEHDEQKQSRDKTTEDNNLNKGSIKKPLNSPGTQISDLRNLCNNGTKNNSTGSTISSLAHGITMVYVPMESLPRSKSAAVLNASLEYDPEISELVTTEASKISQGKTERILDGNPSEDLSPAANGVADKDPDNDSLLESFDSIMFKPRDDQLQNHRHVSPSSSDGSTPSQMTPTTPTNVDNNLSVNVELKPSQVEHIMTSQKVPPPLPPKNPSMLKSKLKSTITFHEAKIEQCKSQSNNESQRDKNIRAAVENLENIINPMGKNENSGVKKSSKVFKRVTLTLPSPTPPEIIDDVLLHYRNNDTDTEIDAYSSTFLTCGHVLKEDNYSTLSSTHSPNTLIDHERIEGIELNCNQYECSPSHNSSLTSSPSAETKEKNRSVLQQLRELSILIGRGNCTDNDGIFNEIQNNTTIQRTAIDEHSNNNKSKCFRLHGSVDQTRKISDATDNSADSGKGSGSSGSAESASGSSPKSHPSSPDSLHTDEIHEKCLQSCVSPACAFRSDCNECLLYNKPPNGFKKPASSEDLCANADNTEKVRTLRKISSNSSRKSSTGSKILRRKSSRSSKSSSNKSLNKFRKKKPVVLDYCECSCCDAGAFDFDMPVHGLMSPNNNTNRISQQLPNETKSGENIRKISSGSSSSGKSSIKLNRSVAFRNSTRSSISKPKSSPLSNSDLSSNGLFTIEEIEELPSMESKAKKCNSKNYSQGNSIKLINSPLNSDDGGSGNADGSNRGPHWHPDCWLAADPMLGWSDLESLYSLNMKNDKPLSINGECWTCWQEISEIKRNSENPNGTVDRTKRMFIWLNKRHKEFQAPWWQAKKQASIRWIMTKALLHVPKEYLIDPFKESPKSKPTKYRLREEVIRGLVSCKLYTLSLANLYQMTPGGTGFSAHGLNHWDIIKILSRKGVYVAQPSDMKLTESTLRQKPIRMVAHISMIEAIMSLYSKEILVRERMIATLYSFGCTVKPETTSPEKLVIAWINAAVMTLKSYIMSTRNHQLTPEKQNRWLQLPQIGEIRDLCDGIGLCSILAIYCSNDLKISEINVPDPGQTLMIFDSITNHTLVQKLCEELFQETIYHLCVTDFLYIHGYMKQNVLCFLVDLFIHLEINPIMRVNRLTHVPVRVELSQN